MKRQKNDVIKWPSWCVISTDVFYSFAPRASANAFVAFGSSHCWPFHTSNHWKGKVVSFCSRTDCIKLFRLHWSPCQRLNVCLMNIHLHENTAKILDPKRLPKCAQDSSAAPLRYIVSCHSNRNFIRTFIKLSYFRKDNRILLWHLYIHRRTVTMVNSTAQSQQRWRRRLAIVRHAYRRSRFGDPS